MKRQKLSKRKSRRNFKRGNRVKRQNTAQRPMRGGWRL